MKTLRMMTYNIRYDCSTDGPFRWVHRSNMVASMVTFHRADIVGFQEVLLHQLQDLERSFKGTYKWIGAGRDDGHLGGELVPIFYKESKFELIESGNFWLSENPSIPGSRSWGTACPRMATWGIFNTKNPKYPQKRVMFVNTHLDHKSEVARIEGVKLVKQMIASHLNKTQQLHDISVIVVGDFNATENSAPIQTIGAPPGGSNELHLQNAKYTSLTPHHGPISTFTGFKFEVKPPILIDYMFVNEKIRVERHGVLADTFGDNNYASSDHRPVLCDVTLL